MPIRLFNTLVVVFWCSTMSWLFVEKILPALTGGDAPDYLSILAAERAAPDCWRIKWEQKTIGTAVSKVARQPDNTAEITGLVHFERLPLASMVGKLLGPLAVVVQPLLGEAESLKMDMSLVSSTRFDSERKLMGFASTVDVGGMKDFARVEGRVIPGGKLRLAAQIRSNDQATWDSVPLIERELHLPPEVLVNDSLLPQAQLQPLTIGQTWTIPVYRAFPPTSPVQIVQATVERHEIILWEGRDVETLLVLYRGEAGSGINMTQAPMSREWVDADGIVLRREVSFAGVNIEFERVTFGSAPGHDDLLKQLDEEVAGMERGIEKSSARDT